MERKAYPRKSVLASCLILYSVVSHALPQMPFKEKSYLDPKASEVIVTANHCFSVAENSLLEVEPFNENSKRSYKIRQYLDPSIQRELYQKPIDDQIREHKILGRKFCNGIISISDMDLPFTKGNNINDANDGILLIQSTKQQINFIYENLSQMQLLSSKAASGTYSSSQLSALDHQFQFEKKQLKNIVKSATFNGFHLLDHAQKVSIPIHAGKDIQRLSLGNMSLGSAGLNIKELSIDTSEYAASSLVQLKTAISTVLSELEELNKVNKDLMNAAHEDATLTLIDVSNDQISFQNKVPDKTSQGEK